MRRGQIRARLSFAGGLTAQRLEHLDWRRITDELVPGGWDFWNWLRSAGAPASPDLVAQELETAGISLTQAARGDYQHIGGWAMDYGYTAALVRAAKRQPAVSYVPAPNDAYARAYPQGCFGGVWYNPEKQGNVLETWATIKLVERDFAALQALLHAVVHAAFELQLY